MVKLTQVDDEVSSQYESATTQSTTEAKQQVESDSDSDESDFEDDFDYENETIYERIVALKDIIPPSQRSAIGSSVYTIKDYVRSGLSASGNLLWILSSSALLLGVPAALAIMAESQIQEMEKELTLQQSAQDVLAPGSEAAFAEKK